MKRKLWVACFKLQHSDMPICAQYFSTYEGAANWVRFNKPSFLDVRVEMHEIFWNEPYV